MRPKITNVSSTYNAMFYTIITDDTPEIKFFNKRRQCLINLGFQYDLKFSAFGEEGVSDIFAEENNDYVRRANEKYSNIMNFSERTFWQFMKTKNSNVDLMDIE